MKKNTKILLIDVGFLDYFREFYKASKNQVDTKVITKFNVGSDDKDVLNYFYKYSDQMDKGLVRSFVRGLEYWYGYHKTLKYVKAHFFDVIHIHWAIIPKLDYYYFRKIKKHTKKLIYTAHDVIPHIQGEKTHKMYDRIYGVVDKIIIHGDECYSEMEHYFPQYIEKIYVQKFGASEYKGININEQMIVSHDKVRQAINSNRRIFSCIGQIYYNKGFDRVANYWKKYEKNSENILIIAGEIRENTEETLNLFREIENYSNVFINPTRFTDEEAEFYYSVSDLVIIPYRHASMSAVFFSAAQYEKTILVTDAGCMKEYIPDLKNVFFCPNNDLDFEKKISMIIKDKSKQELKIMGKNFSKDIYESFGWQKIISDLIDNCYEIN